jgi:hypothetical protein
MIHVHTNTRFSSNAYEYRDNSESVVSVDGMMHEVAVQKTPCVGPVSFAASIQKNADGTATLTLTCAVVGRTCPRGGSVDDVCCRSAPLRQQRTIEEEEDEEDEEEDAGAAAAGAAGAAGAAATYVPDSPMSMSEASMSDDDSLIDKF